jgi:hypothetical protein
MCTITFRLHRIHYQKQHDYDTNTTTIADFTIKVENIEQNVTQENIKQYLARHITLPLNSQIVKVSMVNDITEILRNREMKSNCETDYLILKRRWKKKRNSIFQVLQNCWDYFITWKMKVPTELELLSKIQQLDTEYSTLQEAVPLFTGVAFVTFLRMKGLIIFLLLPLMNTSFR